MKVVGENSEAVFVEEKQWEGGVNIILIDEETSKEGWISRKGSRRSIRCLTASS